MKITAAGLEFIARHEGKVLDNDGKHRPYNDPAGNATIGYGHLLHYGPVTKEEASMRLDEFGAMSYLRADAEEAEAAVRDSIKAPLLPWQFDAIASWFFNLGLNSATFTSNLVKLLNSGIFWEAKGEGCRWPKAAVEEEFGRWARAGGKVLPGLIIRRENEARLFNEGFYGN